MFYWNGQRVQKDLKELGCFKTVNIVVDTVESEDGEQLYEVLYYNVARTIIGDVPCFACQAPPPPLFFFKLGGFILVSAPYS